MAGDSWIGFSVDALSWQSDGMCRQVDVGDVFFPDKGGSTRDAKIVCRDCAVRPTCLEHALRNEEPHGVWGGMSERERWRIRRGEDVAFRIPGEHKPRQAHNKCAECGDQCGGRAKFCCEPCRTAAVTRSRRESLGDTA